MAQMKQMAELGAIMECQYGADAAIDRCGGDQDHWGGALLDLLRSRSAVTPIHTTGMKTFITKLLEKGLTQAQIDMVARTNPAKLLGLKP
jgi:hypothetical protein